jgi:hypothetical protein
MLAVRQGSEPDKAKKVVDFLLAKSVSPAETNHIKGYLNCLFRCMKILTYNCLQAGISMIGSATRISYYDLVLKPRSLSPLLRGSCVGRDRRTGTGRTVTSGKA